MTFHFSLLPPTPIAQLCLMTEPALFVRANPECILVSRGAFFLLVVRSPLSFRTRVVWQSRHEATMKDGARKFKIYFHLLLARILFYLSSVNIYFIVQLMWVYHLQHVTFVRRPTLWDRASVLSTRLTSWKSFMESMMYIIVTAPQFSPIVITCIVCLLGKCCRHCRYSTTLKARLLQQCHARFWLIASSRHRSRMSHSR